jgi:predicted RNase H-like nuclease (RuvC/YqgF family)
MDARTWRNGVALASFVFAALVLTGAPSIAQQQDSTASQQSTGDPVADAARKAREQKKNAAKPKKVYTDEDVSHNTRDIPVASDNSNPATSEEAAAKNAARPAPDAEASPAQGNDAAGTPEETPETRWRKQFKEVYATLDRAQRELDVLQRETNKAQVQYYPDPQKALAEQYTRKDINEHDAKIAAKKQEVAQLQQKIEDMQDALRKSGGDPGWGTP